MKKVTLHIGLHKTGTTFLQQKLLKGLTGISIIRGWHSHRKLIEADLGNQLIISDEGLSGNLFGKSYLDDFYTNISKIKRIYGDPKIIFGIRSQQSFIPSVYKQYLHEKGYQDFVYLYNTNNNGLRKYEDFYLTPKIECLKNTFSDVFIYSQESMINRQEEFLTALSDFLGLEETIMESKDLSHNKSNLGVNTRFQVKTLRTFNKLNARLESISPMLSLYSKLFRRMKITPRNLCQDYLKMVKSPKFEIPAEVKAFIKEKYQEDWEQASERLSY